MLLLHKSFAFGIVLQTGINLFSTVQCLSKPLVKEITIPVDLVLHSDVRAVERSEFDHQVSFAHSLSTLAIH